MQRGEDGGLSGTVDIPDQGIFGLPVSGIRVEGDSVAFAFEGIEPRLEGRVQAGDRKVAGTWITPASSLSVTLVPLADSVAAELPKPPGARRPEPRPADVESPEAIVAAAYDVLSGPAGEAHDWDRFRSLFLPEAKLIPTSRTGPVPSYSAHSVEEFIEVYGENTQEAFYEDEIHSVTERYGDGTSCGSSSGTGCSGWSRGPSTSPGRRRSGTWRSRAGSSPG